MSKALSKSKGFSKRLMVLGMRSPCVSSSTQNNADALQEIKEPSRTLSVISIDFIISVGEGKSVALRETHSCCSISRPNCASSINRGTPFVAVVSSLPPRPAPVIKGQKAAAAINRDLPDITITRPPAHPRPKFSISFFAREEAIMYLHLDYDLTFSFLPRKPSPLPPAMIKRL